LFITASEKMNILVTGAAGFIGSHVCEYYLNREHIVTGIDNFDPFYPEKFKQNNIKGFKDNPSFKLYRGDIRDRDLLESVFSLVKPDVIIHLAAKAGVRPSIEAVEEYYDVNVNGTLALLGQMKRTGVKRMLFASSSSVYGNNPKLPFSESDPVDNPISPYASTKKSGELLCHVYSYLYGFDITCLRFFTVYGPRQRPDLAIHKFTRLIDEGEPLPFFGDGSTARDYAFIDDILNGINGALINLGGYRLYNLGESKVISLEKMVATIEDTLGKKAMLNKLPMQQGDVNITYADISRARSEIAYNPKTDFSQGIKQFVGWYLHSKDFS